MLIYCPFIFSCCRHVFCCNLYDSFIRLRIFGFGISCNAICRINDIIILLLFLLLCFLYLLMLCTKCTFHLHLQMLALVPPVKMCRFLLYHECDRDISVRLFHKPATDYDSNILRRNNHVQHKSGKFMDAFCRNYMCDVENRL